MNNAKRRKKIVEVSVAQYPGRKYWFV
jgi:hypothetical protein